MVCVGVRVCAYTCQSREKIQAKTMMIPIAKPMATPVSIDGVNPEEKHVRKLA
jgi:hypothetical protein